MSKLVLETLDEIEAYVHRYKAWPAAKGLELRELIEKDQQALERIASSGQLFKPAYESVRLAREVLNG